MNNTASFKKLLHDLHWSIASPPLLLGDDDPIADWPDAAFFATLWHAHQQPAITPRDVDELPRLRLGHYFEHLWHLWLRDHPRYQIVLANAPWRENGITLGETDLIVRDRQSGQIEHWELAVKFYLGVGDLNLRSHWHGPQFRDRLDLKFEHLRAMQTRLTLTTSVQQQLSERGIQIAKIRCMVKGRLFLPWQDYWNNSAISFAAPGAQRGFWLTRSQWQNVVNEFPFYQRLSREQFLAPHIFDQQQSASAELVNDEGQRPVAIAITDKAGVEQCRGFIVSGDWPQQAGILQLEKSAP